MNLTQFKKILRQVFLLPVIALLLLAAALLFQIMGASDTVRLIQQSDARISQAMLVARLMVDAESGLRGFETTADNRFLVPFQNAQAHVQTELDRLDNIAGPDAEERRSTADLRTKYQTWHEGFALPVIANVQAGGQANDATLNLEGNRLMDQVRKDLDDIILSAAQRRAKRIERWHHQVHTMIGFLIALALGMGVSIGLFTRSRLHAVSDAYRSSLDVLSRRAEELYQSEQRLSTTLDSIGDGVITCDSSGTVSRMNPVARELTGWGQDEAGGKPLETIFHILDIGTREPGESMLAKLRRNNGKAAEARQATLVRKNGSEITISDSAAPIRNQRGETIGSVLVFRDITLERKTQEALVATEKLAVAGRLAATIAHEIHNPLDSVANLLYLMGNGASEAERKRFLDIAEQELARVTQISRAMLGLYRESKAPVMVDLGEMLEEVLLLMERRFTEMGVTVKRQLPKGICVAAFPAELRQVFSNLIGNAAEAAGAGGEIAVNIQSQPAEVDSSGRPVPDGAVILIGDNGPGIEDDVRSQLFQPFFTTKGEQGTGLGLWVSQGIINKHGGRIAIESNRDNGQHGTTVSVFLATRPTISADAA